MLSSPDLGALVFVDLGPGGESYFSAYKGAVLNPYVRWPSLMTASGQRRKFLLDWDAMRADCEYLLDWEDCDNLCKRLQDQQLLKAGDRANGALDCLGM
jgi:hypothetical protein